ncbi:MAG: hypothetical protein GY787_06170 [Alteromonadales bacterium]|nr:hypothetical protein [Alteromonadales bacterium]
MPREYKIGRITRGLAKDIKKTASPIIKKVYLMQKTVVGGETPLDTPAVTVTPVLLVDAIFKSYDKELIGGNIVAGDRELVSNNDVEIQTGDIIKQGNDEFIVIDVDVKAPTSDVLCYIAQVRQQ